VKQLWVRRWGTGIGGVILSGFLMAAGLNTSPYILPASIQRSVTPGSTVTIPITVEHDTSADTVSIVPAGNALNGGLAFPIGSSPTIRADETPFFPTADYHLTPDGPGHFLFTVSVPKGSPAGLYEAGIAVSHTATTTQISHSTHTTMRLNTVSRTVVAMQWTVTGALAAASPTLGRPVTGMTPQGLATMMTIKNPSRSVFHGPLPITLTIREDGRTIFVAHDSLSTIQPQSTVTAPPILWKFATVPGTYTVTESAGGLGSQQATQTLSPAQAKDSQAAVASVTHQAPVVTSIWQFVPAWIWGVLAAFLAVFGYLLWMLRRVKQGTSVTHVEEH